MRTRLWLIILLLVWTGQCVPNVPPEQKASGRAIWFLPENLTRLIAVDIRRRALEPQPCAPSRVRRQRGGKRPQFQRPRAPTLQEEQEAQAEKARKAKSESVSIPSGGG